ncbi:MAG: fibronectin type III domain-containing protein [Phycisphaerae bacterium]|nr:fibronectin type III domain-containing protein [Phycisphaerae bacterium]
MNIEVDSAVIGTLTLNGGLPALSYTDVTVTFTGGIPAGDHCIGFDAIITDANSSNNYNSGCWTWTGFVDIEITSVSEPTNLNALEDTDVTVRITNIGTAASATFDVNIEVDSAVIGTLTLNGGLPALSYTDVTVTFTGGIPAGDHCIGFDAIITDANSGNNYNSGCWTWTGFVDIEITSVSEPTNLNALEDTDVTVRITNIGTADSGTFDVNIEVDFEIIGTLTFNEGLPALSYTDVTVTFTGGIPAGYHCIGFDAIITDANSGNNYNSGCWTWTGFVDIEITSVSEPTNLNALEDTDVTVRITNLGTADSGTFDVNIEVDFEIIGTLTFNEGLPALSYTDVTVTFTGGIPAGYHCIGFDAIITDANSSNNYNVGCWTWTGFVDIEITSISEPTNLNALEDTDVTVRITNLGTADSGTFDVNIEVDFEVIGTLTFNEGLPALSYTDVTITFTGGIPTGYHCIGFEAIITDANSSNNYNVGCWTWTGFVDIEITQIFEPSPLAALADTDVTVRITNWGSEESGEFYVEIGVDSMSVGGFTISSMPALSYADVTVTFLGGFLAGNHCISFEAIITDANSGNNYNSGCWTWTGFVDIEITDIFEPVPLAALADTDVMVRITNWGSEESGEFYVEIGVDSVSVGGFTMSGMPGLSYADVTVTFTGGFLAGNHCIEFIAMISDADNANNSREECFEFAGIRDVEITDIFEPSPLAALVVTDVTVRITNWGAEASGEFIVDVEVDSAMVGGFTMPSIPPTSYADVAVTFTPGFSPGNHCIAFIASISDDNNANNWREECFDFGEAPSVPVVSNVVAVQRSDAGALVDIYYHLADAEGDACTVALKISNDLGGSWTVPVSSATGDVGFNVTPGAARHVVWDPAVDAPGQTGCSFQARITADDGQDGTGQAESATFCLAEDAPANTIRIGQLTITGDLITEVSGDVRQITGHVTINGVIRLTGTVIANTNTLRVNGNGQVWIDNVPLLGNVMVYEGPWEFDGQSAATTAINKVLSGLKVIGLDVTVEQLEIINDGIRLRGSLTMPDLLNGAKLAITGDDYIQLTRASGLEFSGATIFIPDTDSMSLLGMPFKTDSVSLHISSNEIQIRGRLELGTLLGGTTIDLSTDQNHVSITKVGGQPHVEVIGTLTISGPITVGPGFSLEDMSFTVDTVQAIMQGDGTLNVPSGYGIVAGVGFRNGYFNYVHAGVTDMGLVIIYTPTPPPVPIVYWQDVEASLDELAPGPPPVVLRGSMGFTAGPQIGGYCLLRLNGTAEYNTAGRFTGTLAVLMGGGSDPFEFASAMIVIDRTYGLYLQGRMNYIGILDVEGELRVDLSNNMQGRLEGDIHTPDWLGDLTLANVVFYAQVYDDADLTNDYIIGGVEVPVLFGFETAVKFDLHSGDIDWHADMGLIDEVNVPPPAPGAIRMDKLTNHLFDLPPGLKGAILEADWDEGDTDLNLIRPDGTVITPENVDSFDDVKYFKDVVGRQAFYAVVAPEGGTWQISVLNSAAIGGYRVRALKKTDQPVIQIVQPVVDTSSSPVMITWTSADDDSDATIDLFYDSDRHGTDGLPIVSGLSENDSVHTYIWDTSEVPAGTYYVYAKINDGENLPMISYSVGRVTVIDPDAPSAPANLAMLAGPSAGEVTLSWAAPAGGIDHYEVLLAPDAAGEGYPMVRMAGEQTTLVLDDLSPGEQYRVGMVVVGTNGARSQPASPILVTVTDPVNHKPVFVGGIATRATQDMPYQAQILAGDLDGDPISYSLVDEPVGMMVSTSGLVEWVPDQNNVGMNTFTVTLDDLNGGTNQESFIVHVAPTGTTGRLPEIVSQAPPEVAPAGSYSYQVLAVDPDEGDSLSYDLLDKPVGATISEAGLIQWTAGGASAWCDFAVKVTDASGRFHLQRFSVLVDPDAPLGDAQAWGEVTATDIDMIEVTANAAPDASGTIEFQFEQDGTPGVWQDSPKLVAYGLSPNTAHTFRVKLRDRAVVRNEFGWSDPVTVYTLAQTPPAPILVSAELDTLNVQLSSGDNPAGTQLALFNVSTGQWVDGAGQPSTVAVWADAATWGTIPVGGLTFDTTYQLQCKARNEVDGIETDFGPILAAETAAPDSQAEVIADSESLYENRPGSTHSQVTVTASFQNDPYGNSSYTYTWQAPAHPATGLALVLVAGGGANDASATYAAPETPSGDLLPYEIQCVITGADVGNYVTGTVQVTVVNGGDADQDGDIDLDDYAVFADCLAGSGVTPNPPAPITTQNCLDAFDFDVDDDVDLRDFGKFQAVFTGS